MIMMLLYVMMMMMMMMMMMLLLCRIEEQECVHTNDIIWKTVYADKRMSALSLKYLPRLWLNLAKAVAEDGRNVPVKGEGGG